MKFNKKSGLISLFVGCTLLSSCDYIASYSTKIRQGNIIEPHEVAQIKKGMTKEQVASIMGNPVLENTFDKDRWLYVYTFKKGRQHLQHKRFIVTFNQDRVESTEYENNQGYISH